MEPGWGDLAIGLAEGQLYWWSSRHLVCADLATETSQSVALLDEDILTVFRLAQGWLVVCESSVRLLDGPQETSRVELRDVVVSVDWSADDLLVTDAQGSVVTVKIGPNLTAET